jgi:FlaA1/EpsC-like NDP-sugar epimerase/lipopolysaccharide/colanic/teichoic acid biosynthesis glycosyltransferase
MRGLDLVASGLGLFVLAPLFLLIGLAIKFTSPGPAFYRAERVGWGGRAFTLYKFRSMVQNADRRGPGITGGGDPRVTQVGRFLRRAKLDELPQLINVLRGEMSLVGPRPEDPRYVALYTPEQRRVLAARPGITSHASLHYIEEEDLLAGADWETTYRRRVMPHKLSMDLAYLRQRSAWTDLALILKTVAALFRLPVWIDLVQKLRNRHFFLLDGIAFMLIPALALCLRLERWGWWPGMARALVLFTLAAVAVKISIFYKMGLYRRYWRYAGVDDLARVMVAAGLSTLALTSLFYYLHASLEPYRLAMFRTVPVIDGMLTALVVVGYRFGLRGLYHWQQRSRSLLGGRRVLVVGAGEQGTMAVSEMRANPQLDMEPLAFVDDDPAKIGSRIQNLPVLGASQDIPELVDRYQIQRIILAIPSAPLPRRREILAICERSGVATHSLPGMYKILAGHKTISRLPRVDINRLLNREPVTTNQDEVAGLVRDARVLVTGAGGSIGSELCRQIARHNPGQMILLGHGENSISEIDLDLRLSAPGLATQPVVADVRNRQRVNYMVEKYRPDVIFHAAAHKHVPLMEDNAEEAITTNILGTRNVVGAAQRYGVGRLVLVSSDKAVNATNVMGATKRLAELLVVAAAQRSGRAYMAVRFGNVLGSRGSVIPIFQRQIAAGGPLTVTHPDMYRYFMTIPEAVQLMLQAAVLGQGGEVFVLDMDQPVRILDLANELILLSGLKVGRDIQIVFSGVRPGEKLNEELFLADEDCRRTKHPKIFATTPEDPIQAAALEQVVIEFIYLAQQMQDQNETQSLGELVTQICFYIDQYQPGRELPATVATPESLLSSGSPCFRPLPGVV